MSEVREQAQVAGTAQVDVDPEQMDEVLGEGSAEATGQRLGPGRLWGRLMHREPNPDLDDMDELDDRLFFSREAAAKFAQRGLGKFTQVGGTALEDFIWASINLGASMYRNTDAEPDAVGDDQAAADSIDEGRSINI